MKFAGSLLLIVALALFTSPADATRMSHVGDSVVDNLDGTFTYTYTVFNDSPPGEGLPSDEIVIEPEGDFIIRDWELPYFPDAGIDLTQILSPLGWSFAIETIGTANSATGWDGVANWQDPSDPFYFGPTSPFSTHTQVLHWYVTNPLDVVNPAFGIFPQFSRNGFSFVAAFDRTDAPYQASWFLLPVQTGDPAFPIGGLPASPLATRDIPEPTTLALLGMGAIGMVGRRRRDKRARVA